MFLSNTEPFTSLGCALNVVFHVLRGLVPQDAGTPLLLLLQFFNLPIISIAVLRACPQRRVTEKRHLFHTNRILRGRQRLHPLSHPLRRCNPVTTSNCNYCSALCHPLPFSCCWPMSKIKLHCLTLEKKRCSRRAGTTGCSYTFV
jgi:hypothetical protein